MEIRMQSDWKSILREELEKPYFQELLSFVEQEYENGICFPPKDKIFSAFQHTSFAEVKVVIIGQDPYHGPGQSHGLCFSVGKDVTIPPSLKNIFKELQEDLEVPYPSHGNLQHWAEQGVLLLNATMTVRAHEAGSHQGKGWEKFTNAVIDKISKEKEGVVFLLWGGPAKKKGVKIDKTKHLILESGHPSPLAANRGYWFGNKHFSLTNAYLESRGEQPISW